MVTRRVAKPISKGGACGCGRAVDDDGEVLDVLVQRRCNL
jgi:hypothetical protein